MSINGPSGSKRLSVEETNTLLFKKEFLDEGSPKKVRLEVTPKKDKVTKLGPFVIGASNYNSPERRRLPNSPSTPNKVRHIAMPPTPPKRNRQVKRVLFPVENSQVVDRPLFSNLINVYGWSEYKKALDEHYIDSKTYFAPGKNLTVIKQKGKKSCGATCALMLALDQKTNFTTQDLPVSDNFIEWFYSCNLTRADVLKDKLEKENFNPKILNFIKNKNQSEKNQDETIETKYFDDGFSILKDIKEIIDRTNNSVIIAIDHPELEAHWIIIDYVDVAEAKIYLRDPFSGNAYCSELNEIARYIYNPEDGCIKIEGFYLQS